jgi:type VI secretion system protein ImpK
MRHRIDALLKQMEQRGGASGYQGGQIQSAKFALAAYVDEMVLTVHFNLRDEWEKYPLQLEYFGEQLAGVKFFDRLGELLKDTPGNADVIEVYYMCLLLGFKGKYKLYYEDQLKGVVGTVADQLRRAGRLRNVALSPHWRVDDQPPPPAPVGVPTWVKIAGGATLGSVVLIYLVLYYLLGNILYAAKEQLLR